MQTALTWGMPQRSLPTVTSAVRPPTSSLPLTLGRDTPKVRWRATSRAAQRTTTRAATTMRAMIIGGGLGTYYTREPMALRTPLYDRHIAAGARMVEFGGFDMPLQYSTIREEHIAVRTRCGLFDLSHMGEVRFSGDLALEVVQRLVTNDVARLEVGGALYGVMCNDAGGIVDDVVVYREARGYMVVINAACRPKDVAWMGGHSGESTFQDVGDAVALLAVQGPLAVALVNRLCATDVAEVRPFHSIESQVAGVEATVSRTGYTGEDGFELYV